MNPARTLPRLLRANAPVCFPPQTRPRRSSECVCTSFRATLFMNSVSRVSVRFQLRMVPFVHAQNVSERQTINKSQDTYSLVHVFPTILDCSHAQTCAGGRLRQTPSINHMQIHFGYHLTIGLSLHSHTSLLLCHMQPI